MFALAILFFGSHTFADQPSCDSKIFCQGNLLHTVQMARVFPDSKDFVDMKMKKSESTILANFKKLLGTTGNKPKEGDIKKFVEDHFEPGDELTDFTPTDFTPAPELLKHIHDRNIRTFAKNVVSMWPKLTKKVKQDVFDNPSKYTLIPGKSGFVVPGGRFREFYYWDSYWIIRGLILSDMLVTAGGMINNYLEIVDKYGFLPSGARIYYLNRSQPPLLTLMVANYFEATNNREWLKKAIPKLKKEIQFWLNHRTVKIKKSGVEYTVFRYNVASGSPRPESYYEDFTAASNLTEKEKSEFYSNVKSAAESGWDFSSRWFFDNKGGNNNGSLNSIQTRRVVPVDLNCFLAQAFDKLSMFYKKLKDKSNAKFWKKKALLWQGVIEDVFWDRDDGTWYDWDLKLNKPRKYFYPSNFAPLFTQTYDTKRGKYLGERAVAYIKRHNLLNFKGGVPTSFNKTGQQWDLPNAWPPLQSMMVMGLENTGNAQAKALAKELAQRTIASFRLGFDKNKAMFEKYDANIPGKYGGEGGNTSRNGFGWTNGVALEFIDKYYAKRSPIMKLQKMLQLQKTGGKGYNN